MTTPRALLWVIAFSLGTGIPAEAKFCTADEVPAATLLLPYFEVDVADPNGLTTLFSINNALDTAAIAHVTLWTDWGMPTIDFDVYLTGYDVQTLNLRDLFNGHLPRTASDGQDPTDTISPQGFLSQDLNFSSCTTLPYIGMDTLPQLLRTELRLAHSGGNAMTVFGGCVGDNHGDGRMRGYVTVDVARRCSLDYPSTPGYFDEIASRENRLWGTVTYIDAANNSAQQETLVHIEACDPADTANCPTGPGSYTFYGRYVGFDGSDDREPLAASFATSYFEGGAFDGGSRLIVWRDTKRAPAASGAISCTSRPNWYPLPERDVVSFDEQENPRDHCYEPDHVATPPPGTIYVCFPLATQVATIGELQADYADPLPILPGSPFGWLYLDLRHTLPTGDPMPGRAQAWVTALSSASGRFATAVDAIRLDSACDPSARPILLEIE